MRGHGSAVVHRMDSAGCGYGQAVSSWEDGRERLDLIRHRNFSDQMSDHQLCGVTSYGPVGLGSVRHICGLPSLISCEEACVDCGIEHCSCTGGSSNGQVGPAASAERRDCCAAGQIVT
jgi:hypothetical protein